MLRWNGCHRTPARFSMTAEDAVLVYNQNLAIAAYSVLTARSHVLRSSPDRPVCRSDAPPLPAALDLSVQPLSERRNVAAAIFSFSFHRLAKQISAKKLSYPAVSTPEGRG